jgi:hypothetical protein
VVTEAMRQQTLGPSVSDGAGKPKHATAAAALKDGEEALGVYLSLPKWDHGVLAVEMSQAAADLAGQMGAPIFGGNILAAVAPEVSPKMLSDHLLRAAELFLQGEDTARTRLVLEYAQTRLVKRESHRWMAVEKGLTARLALEDQARTAPEPKIDLGVDAAEVSREVAAAFAAMGRSRLVTGKNPAGGEEARR